jgi:hypothetical protein
MKFRKKPVDVEAVRFNPADELPPSIRAVHRFGADEGCDDFYVTTIQGVTTQIKAGEWIMPEPDGEHYYPCADRGDGLAPLGYEPVKETT